MTLKQRMRFSCEIQWTKTERISKKLHYLAQPSKTGQTIQYNKCSFDSNAYYIWRQCKICWYACSLWHKNEMKLKQRARFNCEILLTKTEKEILKSCHYLAQPSKTEQTIQDNEYSLNSNAYIWRRCKICWYACSLWRKYEMTLKQWVKFS